MGFFDLITAPYKAFAADVASVVPTTGKRATKLGARVLAGLTLAVPAVRAFVKPAVITTLKHPIKTLTGVSAALLGVGVLKESEKARVWVKERAEELPSKPGEIISLGEEIGKKIEGEDVEVGVGEAFKTAGKAGLVAAGILAIPKIVEKVKDIHIPELPGTSVSIPEAPVIPTLPEIPLEQPGELNTALLPQTVDITPKKRKRRAKKVVAPIKIINKNYLSVENYI